MNPMCATNIEIHVNNPKTVTRLTLRNQHENGRDVQVFEDSS